MTAQHATGPLAGVLKYDILTALSVAGLAGPPGMRTTLMRLMALITARYNWQADELCVGQRDMARMWSVDERTVKRQIKRMLDEGFLVCKRPGVRGRVGAYRLNQSAIARFSEGFWSLVGPDFEARMQARFRPDAAKVVRIENFAAKEPAPQTAGQGAGPWGRAMGRLRRQDAAQYDAWFARLVLVSLDTGELRVRCQSAFIQRYIETHLLQRLTEAVEAEAGPLADVVFQ